MEDDKMIEKERSTKYNDKIIIIVTINGEEKELLTNPTTRLVDLLRNEWQLTGTKVSCEIGRCGACSVITDGKLVNSCLVRAYQIDQKAITTIEGLRGSELHPIQKAFLEEGGFQCGYCTPGMVMATKALLDQHPKPTSDQMLEALSGNLCRCTGYGGIVRAIQCLTS